MATERFKFGVAGFKSLSSLPILNGFEDLGAVRAPAARTDYASEPKWEKVYRLQKLGVEDQLELAKVLRLRLARLGFEKLTRRVNFCKGLPRGVVEG